MSVIDPDHLLDQAAKLIRLDGEGAARQVALRRAVSNAYYSVFHLIAAALADQFVGSTKRNVAQYGLVYRLVSHGDLAKLCEDLSKKTPPRRFTSYLPTGGFGTNLVAVFAAVKDLQEKRYSADYNPTMKFHTSYAVLAISTAQSALARFRAAPDVEKAAFLSLLAFRSSFAVK
jgi:hypothetical protein